MENLEEKITPGTKVNNNKWKEIKAHLIAIPIIVTVLGGSIYAGVCIDKTIKKTREEFQQRIYQSLPQEVRSYDLNKNGVLDSEEVKALLRDYSPKNR